MSDDTRLADLKAKLARREGRPEYASNVDALRAEIARMEADSVDMKPPLP